MNREHGTNAVEIIVQERSWAYERSAAGDPTLPAFVAKIKRTFLSHACVASVFTAEDGRTARPRMKTAEYNISVATVEHAIVFSVARKYTA